MPILWAIHLCYIVSMANISDKQGFFSPQLSPAYVTTKTIFEFGTRKKIQSKGTLNTVLDAKCIVVI